jgi:hypothetical protein
LIPKRISGATNYLGAPKGWHPETDGDCCHLAVRMVNEAGIQIAESAWEPTPDELAALNAGGSVVLRVVGGQPPVMLYVEPAQEENVDG